jgi:hypothetical protein
MKNFFSLLTAFIFVTVLCKISFAQTQVSVLNPTVIKPSLQTANVDKMPITKKHPVLMDQHIKSVPAKAPLIAPVKSVSSIGRRPLLPTEQQKLQESENEKK